MKVRLKKIKGGENCVYQLSDNSFIGRNKITEGSLPVNLSDDGFSVCVAGHTVFLTWDIVERFKNSEDDELEFDTKYENPKEVQPCN